MVRLNLVRTAALFIVMMIAVPTQAVVLKIATHRQARTL